MMAQRDLSKALGRNCFLKLRLAFRELQTQYFHGSTLHLYVHLSSDFAGLQAAGIGLRLLIVSGAAVPVQYSPPIGSEQPLPALQRLSKNEPGKLMDSIATVYAIRALLLAFINAARPCTASALLGETTSTGLEDGRDVESAQRGDKPDPDDIKCDLLQLCANLIARRFRF
jgi:hypothetical protein